MRLACRLASAMVLVAVAVASASAASAASQPSAATGSAAQSGAETFKRLYDFGLGKRASYVAEYKRLPMYNFGIGKRAMQAAPGFAPPGSGPPALSGVGAAPGVYSFGIGKRADDDVDSEQHFDMSQNDVDDSSAYDLSKRGKMYSFGLGKRGRLQYAFGIGKRIPAETDSRLEDFLLSPEVLQAEDLFDANNEADRREAWSKRRATQYSFGLGKRRGRYEFGLGKRMATSAQAAEAD